MYCKSKFTHASRDSVRFHFQRYVGELSSEPSSFELWLGNLLDVILASLLQLKGRLWPFDRARRHSAQGYMITSVLVVVVLISYTVYFARNHP